MFTPSKVEGPRPRVYPDRRRGTLLILPGSIPSRHELPTVYACSPLISHPLPSAHPPFPPSSRAVSPSSTAFTPNRRLTPLSTAFTQTHRGWGASHRARVTCHVFPRPLFSYSYELLFSQALYLDNHPHCRGCGVSTILRYLRWRLSGLVPQRNPICPRSRLQYTFVRTSHNIRTSPRRSWISA
jgi:hypothetical protein